MMLKHSFLALATVAFAGGLQAAEYPQQEARIENGIDPRCPRFFSYSELKTMFTRLKSFPNATQAIDKNGYTFSEHTFKCNGDIIAPSNPPLNPLRIITNMTIQTLTKQVAKTPVIRNSRRFICWYKYQNATGKITGNWHEYAIEGLDLKYIHQPMCQKGYFGME